MNNFELHELTTTLSDTLKDSLKGSKYMITENIYKSIRTLRHFAPAELSGFNLYFQTPKVRLRGKVVECRWTAICKGVDVHQQECFTFEELEYSKVPLESRLEYSLESFRKYWVRSWVRK